MAKKLTAAQVKGLQQMESCVPSQSVRFRTGESLRKLGYADRYTTYITKAEYAVKDRIYTQFRYPARRPNVRHEWYITSAGREYLASVAP